MAQQCGFNVHFIHLEATLYSAKTCENCGRGKLRAAPMRGLAMRHGMSVWIEGGTGALRMHLMREKTTLCEGDFNCGLTRSEGRFGYRLKGGGKNYCDCNSNQLYKIILFIPLLPYFPTLPIRHLLFPTLPTYTTYPQHHQKKCPQHPKKNIIIIGAGVGGVALAGRLSRAGHTVTVVEKNDFVGGRCSLIHHNGFRFDQGPSLWLMPKVFEEAFRDVGEKVEDHVKLVKCDPNYIIHFHDGDKIRLTTDMDELKKEVERIEPGSYEGEYLALVGCFLGCWC